MSRVIVQIDKQLSFFHLIAKKLKVSVPKNCILHRFPGMADFAPIISLSGEYIDKNINGIRGVYVVLIWFPQIQSLEPVYVGSGDIYN